MANPSWIVVAVAAFLLAVVWAGTNSCTQGYKYSPNYNYIGSDYLAELPASKGNPNFDQDISAVDFANVVGTVDYTASNVHLNNVGARFQKLHDSTKLPASTSYLTNYDTDVANPAFYAYSARNPRVVIRSRLYDQADPFRGDIPIKKHDNVALIEKSSRGRESQRMSGTFNPQYDQMIADYVHANESKKNMPIVVAREGTVMDMTPAPVPVKA
jgi:hypothetical protein